MAGWMGLGMDIGVLLVCLEVWGLCGMDPRWIGPFSGAADLDRME